MDAQDASPVATAGFDTDERGTALTFLVVDTHLTGSGLEAVHHLLDFRSVRYSSIRVFMRLATSSNRWI